VAQMVNGSILGVATNGTILIRNKLYGDTWRQVRRRQPRGALAAQRVLVSAPVPAAAPGHSVAARGLAWLRCGSALQRVQIQAPGDLNFNVRSIVVPGPGGSAASGRPGLQEAGPAPLRWACIGCAVKP
jgi:hypothetical protein